MALLQIIKFMRLLTIVTLLCISVSANADIYFCVAERYGEVASGYPRTGTLLEKEEFLTVDVYNTIIDTEIGFKTADDDLSSEYKGSCTESKSLIVCQLIEENGKRSILIDITRPNLEYSSVSQYFSDVSIFYGEVGTCTKV